MAMIPSQLRDLSEQVARDGKEVTTVRTILSWFGWYRRSWRNVAVIRAALKELNLTTFPDFEAPHIDAWITIERIRGPGPSPAEPVSPVTSTTTSTTTTTPEPPHPQVEAISEAAPVAQRIEPAHQISRLKSANKPPVWVKPDATTEQAITIMLLNDYSQLPVMQSERDPKGIFSWRTLGSRLVLGRSANMYANPWTHTKS